MQVVPESHIGQHGEVGGRRKRVPEFSVVRIPPLYAAHSEPGKFAGLSVRPALRLLLADFPLACKRSEGRSARHPLPAVPEGCGEAIAYNRSTRQMLQDDDQPKAKKPFQRDEKYYPLSLRGLLSS